MEPVRLVVDLCERTIVLREGRVVADGPTAEIMSGPELLESCGLEKPLRLQSCPVCGNQKTVGGKAK